MDLEDVALPLSLLIPCGLLVHELLTNALKMTPQPGSQARFTPLGRYPYVRTTREPGIARPTLLPRIFRVYLRVVFM
jgi:hypothetical protein